MLSGLVGSEMCIRDSTDVATVIFEQGNKLAVTVEYSIVGQPIIESINFVLQRPE